MAMHVLHVKCADCSRQFLVRKPKNMKLLPKILKLVICPYCHPEQSDEVCGGCRLPFLVVGNHTSELCLACFFREWSRERTQKLIRAVANVVIKKADLI